jgi:hypothetical protein
VPRLLLAAVVAAALGCGTTPDRPYAPLPGGLSEDSARAVLGRFAAAVEAGRWPEAYALLSARWRAGYTPARLAVDFGGAGPAGREAAERVKALLAAGSPLRRDGERLALPIGTGRVATLVPEDGAWRVDSLE